MSEVETTEAVESSADEAALDGAAEAATTPSEEPVSTWKARVAGKDRALTAAKQEAQRLAEENARLLAWKAEQEQASLSEVERLQLRIKEMERREAEAIAAAERARLAREFPQAFEWLGDDAPTDPGRLAEIEARLKSLSAPPEPEPAPEPRVEPNNPRRPNVVMQPTNPSIAQLQADAKGHGALNTLPSFTAKVPMTLTDR